MSTIYQLIFNTICQRNVSHIDWKTFISMKLPGASPQASSATAAHSCLDAPDTCLSPRSARSRKRGIRIQIF